MSRIKVFVGAVVGTLAVGHACALEPALAIFEDGFQCLLGGAEDGVFLRSDAAAPLMTDKQDYRLFALEGDFGVITGAAAVATKEPCLLGGSFRVPTGALPAGIGNAIAVATKRDPGPAALRLDDPTEPVYRELVANFLRERGFTTEVAHVEQAIHTDLDGDGVEDLLVTASNQSFETGVGGGLGTYSVVLPQWQAGQGRKTLVVAESLFPREDPASLALAFQVVGVLDLDGDGQHDIMIRSDYYEGRTIDVFRGNSQGFTHVADCGCGL